MSELNAIIPASANDHHDALADLLAPRLREVLGEAGPGHRLRVTTLPEAVMARLGQALSDERWVVRVLNEHPTQAFEASAATIIRLRDHAEAPLLVFFPPGPRTASEDSLDIATFTELSLSSIAQNLADALLDRIPEPLRAAVRDVLKHLAEVRQVRHPDELVNYLLTVLKNGGTAEAAGAAVYVFGLVPDFELFTREAGMTLNRVSRNQKACEKLADVNQPLQKRLRLLNLKPGTLQQELFRFFRVRHTEEPRTWGHFVACDAGVRQLAFDRWEFAEAEADGELRLILDPLNLPKQQADQVSGADRMPVLNVTGRDPLKLVFRSVPSAAQTPAWKKWRVQILSLGDGAATVAWESNSFATPTGGRLTKVRRSIKVKELEALDEGTYFLRVDAYDSDGVLLTTPRRIDPRDETSRAENESEPFLVVRNELVIDEFDVRATFLPSLTAAWLRGAITALDGKTRETVPQRKELTGAWNQPAGSSVKGDVHFDLETDGFHGFSVVVPGLLRKVEAEFLSNPRALGVYQMALDKARNPGDVQLVRREELDTDAMPLIGRLLATREEVFRRIREAHLPPGAMPEERSARLGVVEVVDLTEHAVAICEYARAFGEVVNAAMGLDRTDRAPLLRALAWLDTIEIRWRAQSGDPGRGLLIAPTHPVRMLWHLGHAAECAAAVEAWDKHSHDVPHWRRFIEQLRDSLLPLNLPLALFDRRVRAYTETIPVTPFWGLYLPDRDDAGKHVDATMARERALSGMGVKSRSVTVSSVEPDQIAARLFEYVVQHPYIEQLQLNVFNPGNGELVANVLRSVEALRRSTQAPSSLRYAVQLFASPGQLDSVGEAVESLLDPERHVAEDDEFTLFSGNHLHPKLLVARNDVADFLADHARFPAHVSILVEQFTAQGRIGRLSNFRRGSFVGGLVQEPETVPLEVTDGASKRVTGWSKGIRPQARSSGGPMERLIADTLAATHRVQAAVAEGQSVDASVGPVIALQLDAEAQALLRQVHEVSDRVITIDRHLGVDFFDTPTAGEETGYLLDFAPEFLQEERQRVVLTTRNTKEIECLLSPTLLGYGVELRPGDEVMVLEGLRSLSGRLALRLEGSTSRAKEVVGLLFARWLMEELGALEDRIVIPLDAHRSWFQGPGSQRRADLLLVGFPGSGIVRMDVVEVKLREDLSAAARGPLYRSMREQTDVTEQRLREMFDPDRFALPRADLPMRAKELAGVLAFYIRRAVRYGLLGVPEGEGALAIAERLDDGYRLDVHRLGIVFERVGSGHHIDEDEPGFTVHRFGANKGRRLFLAAMGRFDERTSLRGDTASATASEASTSITPLAEAPGDEQLLDALRSTLSVVPSRKLGAEHSNVTTSRADVASAPPEALAPATAEIPTSSHLAEGTTEYQPDQVARASAPVTVAAAEPADVHGASLTDGAPVSPISQASSIPTRASAASPGILIGATEHTPQYGILGRSGSQPVAIDLNGCNTISLFGVQGFGKSYTLGVIAEMASARNAGVNLLPSPLATVIFHFHKSDSYEPEYVTAVHPNRKSSEVERLLAEYGAAPRGLEDVVLLAPEAKVEKRRSEYPGVKVEPIKFSSSELGAESWKFLMGAVGNSSLYVRQIVDIMQSYGSELTLQDLEKEIAESDFSKSDLRFANIRLRLARRFVDDSVRLRDLLKPGRTLIVDMRDEWMEKDQALGLFLVIMNTLAQAEHNGVLFNKLMVFDEAHKYISESGLIGEVVAMIREMRHWATSVVIASQDPLSVPRAILELTSVLILHRMTSPQWLKHLRTAIVSLNDVPDAVVTGLRPGEALVWAQRSTDGRFSARPQKITIRPRFTQHGGGTKTAVDGATIR